MSKIIGKSRYEILNSTNNVFIELGLFKTGKAIASMLIKDME